MAESDNESKASAAPRKLGPLRDRGRGRPKPRRVAQLRAEPRTARDFVARRFAPLNRRLSTSGAMALMNSEITHRRLLNQSHSKVESFLPKNVMQRRLIFQKKLTEADPLYFKRHVRVSHEQGFNLRWNKEARLIALDARSSHVHGSAFDFAATAPLPPRPPSSRAATAEVSEKRAVVSAKGKRKGKNRRISRRMPRPATAVHLQNRKAKKLNKLSKTLPSSLVPRPSNAKDIDGLTLAEYINQKGTASTSEDTGTADIGELGGETTGDFLGDMERFGETIFKAPGSAPGANKMMSNDGFKRKSLLNSNLSPLPSTVAA